MFSSAPLAGFYSAVDMLVQTRWNKRAARLEASHLARRCRCPRSRFAANDTAHPGIMAQTFGVVLIYVL
jgi:hypothetical protein